MTLLDASTVCDLRASTHLLPRVTYGSLISTPFAAIPLPEGWMVVTSGRPRCVTSLPLLATLATLEPDALDTILDPTVSPDEAVMDSAVRERRERGRQAAAILARERAERAEKEKRAAERAARERAIARAVDPLSVDLDDL